MTFTAQSIQNGLKSVGYVCEPRLALAMSMAIRLERPLLLEGDAGVGKTYLAEAAAQALERTLIRLQCYEGLDAHQTIYEWNYSRQMLAIARAGHAVGEMREEDLFDESYLIERPLLKAIRQSEAPVLLIDEVDRADEEFEAYLLEILSEYQVSVPELGVIKARSKPLTIITSNGVRDLSDALRRRCLFHHIDYPDMATELRIIQTRIPACSTALAQNIAGFVAALRKEDLQKNPGIAETLDWTAALLGCEIENIADDPEQVHATLLCLLKTKADQDAIPFPVFQRLAAAVA